MLQTILSKLRWSDFFVLAVNVALIAYFFVLRARTKRAKAKTDSTQG